MTIRTRPLHNRIPTKRGAQLVVNRQKGVLFVLAATRTGTGVGRQAKAVVGRAARDYLAGDAVDLVEGAEHERGVVAAEVELDGLDGAVGFAQRVVGYGDGFGGAAGLEGRGGSGERGGGEGGGEGEEVHCCVVLCCVGGDRRVGIE